MRLLRSASFGHRAVVHGCRVMNDCRIGIGVVVMDGAVNEEVASTPAGRTLPLLLLDAARAV